MKKEKRMTYSKLRSRNCVTLEIPWKNDKDHLFPSLNEIIEIAKSWRAWSKRKRECCDILFWLIREQTKVKFNVPVEIEYHAYMCRTRDWDNHGASFKFMGDALQKAGVIKDDDLKHVPRFTPYQHKVATRKEEKVVVLIYEYLQ